MANEYGPRGQQAQFDALNALLLELKTQLNFLRQDFVAHSHGPTYNGDTINIAAIEMEITGDPLASAGVTAPLPSNPLVGD